MSERIPAYEGKQPYIFVSYAHKNSKQVMPIIESLFSDKYRVWYDEGIAPGSEWPKNIEEHLKQATAVLVFVSKESLDSINCENEVANSNPDKRPVFQFLLDDSKNDKIANAEVVYDYNSLKKLLNNELIGDGVSGYERVISKAKKGNYWTGLIVFALALIAVLGTSIYGLYKGWFNDILPGLSPKESVIIKKEKENVMHFDSNVLINTIINQTESRLLEEIEFKQPESKDALFEAINYNEWKKHDNILYGDLVNYTEKELVLNYVNDELLDCMQYFPNLETMVLKEGKITKVSSLQRCSNLKILRITSDFLPFVIPEDIAFDIELYK